MHLCSLTTLVFFLILPDSAAPMLASVADAGDADLPASRTLIGAAP
jgi:hypothetical protein